ESFECVRTAVGVLSLWHMLQQVPCGCAAAERMQRIIHTGDKNHRGREHRSRLDAAYAHAPAQVAELTGLLLEGFFEQRADSTQRERRAVRHPRNAIQHLADG